MNYPRDRIYYFLDGAAEVSLYEQLFPGIRVLKKDDHVLELFSGAKIIQYVENSFSKSSLTRSNKMFLSLYSLHWGRSKQGERG